jgi:serine/threonine-protein kinase HipA
MKVTPVTALKVGLHFQEDTLAVGRLAFKEGVVYFEYDRAFLVKGLEISPLRLPLAPGLKAFNRSLFEGLPGVFNDSLPDGWGRLLLDRTLKQQGILPQTLSPLDRLAQVGRHGMGALVYEPDYSDTPKSPGASLDLDLVAEDTSRILEERPLLGNPQDVLQELLSLGGSSAGARPKAMIGVDATRQRVTHGISPIADGFEAWLVKFPGSSDERDAGAVEYVYALMARQAGIPMMDTHLFPAKTGAGYFASKRFDRDGTKRLHVHTACGLLHSDFRVPALDYDDLMSLTLRLTGDMREVEKMYRIAVFNVAAHNRDDHGKNFSFLMDEAGVWTLAPAYDLTFSSGPSGEQSTMVLGEGKNPSFAHLQKLGKQAGLPKERVQEILGQTVDALSQWPQLARQYGVHTDTIPFIQKCFLRRS